MSERNIKLSARVENTREKRDVTSLVPIQFDLQQIKEHFDKSIDDIKKQFCIADELYSGGKKEEAMDIWRSQIIFIEGILDFFIHEISKMALIKMFKGEWEKSKSYDNFMIPMSTVEEGLKNPESTEWLFSRLNKRFSLEVYLSSDALGTQLSLLGMNYDETCKAAFPKELGVPYVKGQDKLKKLYDRRNQIAHQADRRHETAEKEQIDKAIVEEAISIVTVFVETICNQAKLKLHQ